jgi:FkbM family methyltransferase
MNSIQLMINKRLGRKSIMEVEYSGQQFKLDIIAKREIRRAKQIFHETALLSKMFEHIQDGDVIYDIGSNIGVISLLLSGYKAAANSTVYSFEPEPNNFKQLQKNISLNNCTNSIIPYQLALGKEKGVLDLFVRGSAGEGRHSVAASKGSTGTIQINVETCSAFSETSGSAPDLVKIDVEGAEGQVLLGMEKIMADLQKPRDIFLEIHNKGDEDRMPDGMTSIDEWLTLRNYELLWEQKRRSGSNRQYSIKK